MIINRDGIGDDQVERFCATEGIPILLKIPFEREIARLYSQGIPLVDAIPEWKERFQALYDDVAAETSERRDAGTGRHGNAGA